MYVCVVVLWNCVWCVICGIGVGCVDILLNDWCGDFVWWSWNRIVCFVFCMGVCMVYLYVMDIDVWFDLGYVLNCCYGRNLDVWFFLIYDVFNFVVVVWVFYGVVWCGVFVFCVWSRVWCVVNVFVRFVFFWYFLFSMVVVGCIGWGIWWWWLFLF